jgi:Tfp pilus assembly pilus retraction ATPase PilT
MIVSSNELVLTQLHTKTPEGAIQRMLDIFPEEHEALLRRIIAEKLRAVCAQMLLERADEKGQVAVYGVLIPDDEMRQTIMNGGDVLSRKKPLPKGSQTLAEDIEELYRQGIITEQTKEKAIMEIY